MGGSRSDRPVGLTLTARECGGQGKATPVLPCGPKRPGATDLPTRRLSMETRRQFIVKGATLVAASAAATTVGPTVFSRQADAAGQLKILQWSHFVPAYDKWFDPWAKAWGASKG